MGAFIEPDECKDQAYSGWPLGGNPSALDQLGLDGGRRLIQEKSRPCPVYRIWHGVAGEAIPEPAVGPERGVLETKCPVQKKGRRGLRGTGCGHLLLFLFDQGGLHASIPRLGARGGQVSLVAGCRLIGLRGRRASLAAPGS